MNRIMLAVLLILPAFALAGEKPNPADYTINVHVSRSRNEGGQRLKAVIDGKKYDLVGGGGPLLVLALGDYKAKIVKREQQGTYDSYQIYEFLLPDQKTRQFRVVGQTE